MPHQLIYRRRNVWTEALRWPSNHLSLDAGSGLKTPPATHGCRNCIPFGEPGNVVLADVDAPSTQLFEQSQSHVSSESTP